MNVGKAKSVEVKNQKLQATRDYKKKTIYPGTSPHPMTIGIDNCLQFWEHQSQKHGFLTIHSIEATVTSM